MSSNASHRRGDIALSIQGLGKRYRIAQNQERHRTLTDAIAHRVRHPLERPQFEDFWALRDVSFDVKRGDVVGIVGRNGAGKSTLLKILSRIIRPTTGEVRLYGRVGSLLEVGTGFHPELTGRENIYLNGSILGMSRQEIDREFDAIVDFSETEKFLDTPVKRYSSGMYVRLAFAVAAHLNPEILIIDEVLAVGDAEFQKKCLGKMQNVASSGRTVLFVSHNESAVRSLCNHAILLKSGLVSFSGTPTDVFGKYRATVNPSKFNNKDRTQNNPSIKITDAYLQVDGVQTAEFLPTHQPELVLHIQVTKPHKFSPEVVIRDANGTPIIFAPSGLASGLTYDFPIGEHVILSILHLPYLAAGQYSMDLRVVESGVQLYDSLEQALSFSIMPSSIGGNGWSLRQEYNQGHILIGVSASGQRTIHSPSTLKS